MLVVKRDRREVPFDAEKIQKAIYNSSEGRFTEEQSKELTKEVLKNLPKKERINIEEIQKEVIKVLRKSNNDVANAYVLYRRKRTLERQRRGEMMKNFISKLEMTNVVNQNANVDEVSFGGRKGEAADVLLKDYALNYCMSDMSRENHLNNEIYVHDLNSYALGLHNCFNSSTRFVTYDGVKSFKECYDGQKVKVLDLNGEWREATVHSYGKQSMYKLTFVSKSSQKVVVCTRNHRWVLKDETITDNIQVGQSLKVQKESEEIHLSGCGIEWTLKNIIPYKDGDESGTCTAWCVEEPVTHTFTLDGGMVTGNCLSIPFDDLLKNGFCVKQTDVRPAQSISTAMQLVAVIFQIQSLCQFGLPM